MLGLVIVSLHFSLQESAERGVGAELTVSRYRDCHEDQLGVVGTVAYSSVILVYFFEG
jgi:hypothetical protein